MRSRKVSPGLAVTVTRIQSESTLVPPGDRGAIAAGLANHGRRFAGNRALVHRGDALDDVAVGRDDIPGIDTNDIALAQRRCGHGLERAIGTFALGHRLGLGAPQRVGLRLAPCPRPSLPRSWRTAPSARART